MIYTGDPSKGSIEMREFYQRLLNRRRARYWERDSESDRELMFDILTALVKCLINEGVK